MATQTARRLLNKPTLTDAPNFVTDISSLADALDNYQIDLFGLKAFLPAIGAGANQMSAEDNGALYYATDTHELFRYVHGTGWLSLTGQGRKSIKIGENSVGSSTYSVMSLPDRITNVVMPTDGLMFVQFDGMWNCTIAGGTVGIALFIGGNQLKTAKSATTAPVVQEGLANPSAANNYRPVSLGINGFELGSGGAPAYTGPVTTGQIPAPRLGSGAQVNVASGWCTIFVAAGTYTVEVRYKTSVGSIQAKNRKLWLWTKEFI